MDKKATTVLLGIIVYLLSAGISFTAFSYFRPGSGSAVSQQNGTNPNLTKSGGKFVIPKNPYANLPKTEECPLNGTMHSKPEKENWDKRRPLAVMVENSTDARPQSGLSFADVVYEAVAEGGITRFMGVFYCKESERVGPVRSARTYYLDWASEYGNSPLYAHVGGANSDGPADALGQIKQYHWYLNNDLEGLGTFDFPPLLFFRDPERLKGVALEHTMYIIPQKIWAFAASKRKLSNVEVDDVTGKEIAWDTTFVKWTFKDDAALASRPAKGTAAFNFSAVQSSYLDDYIVKWQYDHDSNSYLRFNGGKPHLDLNTNQQILAKNIAILFMPMSIANDGYSEEGHGTHTLYGDKGVGKAMFMVDGKVVNGTWTKRSRTARTQFADNTGAEIKLNRGLTWVEILPIGQAVTFE